MATDTGAREGTSKSSDTVKAPCYKPLQAAALWSGRATGGTGGRRTQQRLGMS